MVIIALGLDFSEILNIIKGEQDFFFIILEYYTKRKKMTYGSTTCEFKFLLLPLLLRVNVSEQNPSM